MACFSNCKLPVETPANKGCLTYTRAIISLKTTMSTLPFYTPASDNIVTLSRRVVKQVLNSATVPKGFGVIK